MGTPAAGRKKKRGQLLLSPLMDSSIIPAFEEEVCLSDCSNSTGITWIYDARKRSAVRVDTELQWTKFFSDLRNENGTEAKTEEKKRNWNCLHYRNNR